MTSIRLKLYEIMDDDDLWNKARLLYMCSIDLGKPILPSFATYYQSRFIIHEIDDVDHAHKLVLDYLSKSKYIIQFIKYRKKKYGTIFKQNLIGIQFNKQQCQLYIKADKYFVFNTPSSFILSQEELSRYSLKDDDDLKSIYISYFTYNIPKFNHFFPISKNSIPYLSGTLLIGNLNINRWILVQLWGMYSLRQTITYSY